MTLDLHPPTSALPRISRIARLARTAILAIGVLIAASLSGTGGVHAATVQLPCDIYAAAGTPCVAAHSITRALFAAYNGPLYQVKRASDGATANIGVLTAGGYANAAAQAFTPALLQRYDIIGFDP